MTNLGINRRLTQAFIDQSPVDLVLTPRSKVKKPAGGFAWQEGAPRPPQTFTLIEQSSMSGQPAATRTADGVERVVEFELLGTWDATVERGDVFTHAGKDWEVIDLFIPNGYETRAMVSARG